MKILFRRGTRMAPELSSPASMIQTRRVCLLIDTSTSWGVRLIKGIARFSQEIGNWLIHVEPRGRYDRFRIPTGWTGDGIIARINSKPLAQEINASGLPTPSLGREGVATVFYGNPRQVFVTGTVKF